MDHSATIFPASLQLASLALPVRLGCGAPEREKPQTVRVDVTCHFPSLPAACHDDDAAFFCYDVLADMLRKVATAREFRLIEYLAHQMCLALEAWLEASAPAADVNAAHIRYTLRLHKQAPVEGLEGGAIVTISTLPSGVV